VYLEGQGYFEVKATTESPRPFSFYRPPRDGIVRVPDATGTDLFAPWSAYSGRIRVVAKSVGRIGGRSR